MQSGSFKNAAHTPVVNDRVLEDFSAAGTISHRGGDNCIAQPDERDCGEMRVLHRGPSGGRQSVDQSSVPVIGNSIDADEDPEMFYTCPHSGKRFYRLSKQPLSPEWWQSLSAATPDPAYGTYLDEFLAWRHSKSPLIAKEGGS